VKKILQNLNSGATEVIDVPIPQPRTGHLLITTQRSLISSGTERMLVEFGQANLIAKARSQPDKVRQVLDKIRTDGLLPTLEAVFARLDEPLPLGYCNAGVVLDVGEGVTDFSVGDRVVSNGPHAEVVAVPENLCTRIPDGVSDNEAAFTVLAAVGLQGIRLAEPTLGENVAVLGLGLVGLMTVQMLRANGCRVLGTDFDEHKLALARQFGAETVDLSTGADPVAAAEAFSKGRGMDAVLITASTKSSEPVHQAAQMCRKRGRIVLVGVTGLDLNRADFYEKELTFQVSCSYGPGRYDDDYEQQGHDYPYGFVRWTEQRNFQAVLQLMKEGKLHVGPLIARRFPIEEAPKAYDLLTEDKSLLGLLLTYPDQQDVDLRRTIKIGEPSTSLEESTIHNPKSKIGNPIVGMIGAGNFASMVLLPALSKTPAVLKTIASAGGTSAALAARKFGFQQATTDYQTILDDPEINTVFIATRHNLHARIVCEALRAGKHVFVEKPLALNRPQLQEVKKAYQEAQHSPAKSNSDGATGNLQLSTSNFQPMLMIGFNRRFSPLSVKMHDLLQQRTQPITMIYTVNAGAIPADHWTQDPKVGGGRIIGEGCHFIDLLRYLVGVPIVDVQARMMGRAPGVQIRQDKMSIPLVFEDGSLGIVHYFANGTKRFPKERVEVFSEGRILTLDNFKVLKGYDWPGFRRKRLWRQDKGHEAEVAAFAEHITEGGEALIPWHELEEVTLATFAAVEKSAKSS
jgi:predicted dehydrogenase/threonine dehydrogenase-like Zn-dependent dehydrogenase